MAIRQEMGLKYKGKRTFQPLIVWHCYMVFRNVPKEIKFAGNPI